VGVVVGPGAVAVARVLTAPAAVAAAAPARGVGRLPAGLVLGYLGLRLLTPAFRCRRHAVSVPGPRGGRKVRVRASPTVRFPLPRAARVRTIATRIAGNQLPHFVKWYRVTKAWKEGPIMDDSSPSFLIDRSEAAVPAQQPTAAAKFRHDVRNLLNLIKLNCAILRRQPTADATSVESLRDVEQACDDINHMVTDFTTRG